MSHKLRAASKTTIFLKKRMFYDRLLAMGKGEEFIKQVETILNNRIGKVMAGSVLNNNLAKLNKDLANLTKEDGKVLVENIVKAVSLFGTADESKQIKADLEKLLTRLDERRLRRNAWTNCLLSRSFTSFSSTALVLW